MVGHYEHPKVVLDAMLTDEQLLVVRGFDLVRQGELEKFFDLLADDVVFNMLNSEYLNIGFKVHSLTSCDYLFFDRALPVARVSWKERGSRMGKGLH
jgi:hypothetical protein